MRLSLLAAGDLAVTAAALFEATAACGCSAKFMLNFTDRRQPLATQIDKIYIKRRAKFHGRAAGRVLTACAWKEISMAYVRREILATLLSASLLIKFANFISRACADYYADEVYKSACAMQTLGFILPPSQRLNFF